MEIFDNYYAKISFRWMCTLQKILWWHFRILTFSYLRHFPPFLVLGLILVQTAVLAKANKTLFPIWDLFLHLWSWVWFWFRLLCYQRIITVSFKMVNLIWFLKPIRLHNKTFFFNFGLRFDFGSDSCTSKGQQIRFFCTTFSSCLIVLKILKNWYGCTEFDYIFTFNLLKNSKLISTTHN